MRHVAALSLSLCLAGSLFADTGLITTVAGTSFTGSSGLGGPATQAYLNSPYCVVLDSSGNLFIADSGNYRVVRVDAVTGILTLVAGNGTNSYSGDSGPATAAGIGYPYCVALDSTGNIYISDSTNNRIRRVDAASGTISTYVGNGGPINGAAGITVDSFGNLYAVERSGNRVLRVDITGHIDTFAGGGSGGDGGPAIFAALNGPVSVAFDPSGNLYIGELTGGRVRRVAAANGFISTVAGPGNFTFNGDGIPATSAGLPGMGSIAADASGNVFIVSKDRVRRVDGATGVISTVAGIGVNGSSADGIPAASALMSGPAGLALHPSGNLFVTETFAPRVRRIFLPGAARTYTAVTSSASTVDTVSGQSVTITTSVTPIGGVGTPSGNVQFGYVESPSGVSGDLGSIPLVNGSASVTMSNLPAGDIFFTAAYSGDASFWMNSAPNVGVRVHQATATTIASSPNPSSTQQNVTFTITVARAAGPSPFGDQPSGTVQLLQGATVLATAAVTNGTATITRAFSSTGSYVLTASYISDGGIGDYGSSTSAPYTQTVNPKQATTTSVAAQPNPSSPGDSVTITATMSPSTATGTVQFLEGAATLATTTLNGGTASFSSAAFSSGSHTITANYSGDGANQPSSGSVNLSVKTASSVMLTLNNNPQQYGGAAPLTAQVSPAAATGTVQFFDGPDLLGSATIGGGTATFSITTLAVGSHPISCVYSGDANYVGSTSTTLSQTIIKATPTISLTSSPNPSAPGQSVSLTATVAPATATGMVQFMENAIVLGTANVSNGTAVFTTSSLAAGAHSLTASYGGDGNYQSGNSAPYSHTVKAATTTSVAVNPSPSVAGQSVTITATVSPGTATGTVQFLDGATPLGTLALSGGSAAFTTSTLSSGAHTIRATYSGDNGNTGSSGTVDLTVKIVTTTTLTLSNNPQQYGGAVQFTAQVTPQAATGTVQFLDGAQVLGSAPLSGGAATFTTSSLSVGGHTISCVYSGDATYGGSGSSALTQTINKAVPSLAASSSPNPSTYGQSVTLRATLQTSATGTLQFLDGAVVLGTVNVASGVAVYTTAALAVGSHTISASYSGDGNYLSATAWTASAQTVNKAVSALIVSSSPNPSSYGQSVSVTATLAAAATGTVQFLDGGGVLGTVNVSNGAAVYTTAALVVGAHTLSASYSGDGNYQGATSSTQQTVNKAATVTALASSANPGVRNKLITFTATVSPPAGATGQVAFLDDSTVLGTVNLSGGSAGFSTKLGLGAHPITAVYLGDSSFNSSTSAILSEMINQH